MVLTLAELHIMEIVRLETRHPDALAADDSEFEVGSIRVLADADQTPIPDFGGNTDEVPARGIDGLSGGRQGSIEDRPDAGSAQPDRSDHCPGDEQRKFLLPGRKVNNTPDAARKRRAERSATTVAG